MLRALALAADNDTGWEMRYSDRRIRFINMLATGSTGTKSIDLQILIQDLNIDVIGELRENKNRAERSVATSIGIKRRDSD